MGNSTRITQKLETKRGWGGEKYTLDPLRGITGEIRGSFSLFWLVTF